MKLPKNFMVGCNDCNKMNLMFLCHVCFFRNPGLLISFTKFGHVDYRGTFFISDTIDDDIAGVVFGYQSNRWGTLARTNFDTSKVVLYYLF